MKKDGDMDNSDVFVIKIEHENEWWYNGKYRTMDPSEAFKYKTKADAQVICSMLNYRYKKTTVEVVGGEAQ
jgi:hypothetical protein